MPGKQTFVFGLIRLEVGAGKGSWKRELEVGPPLRRYLINCSRWWVDNLLLLGTCSQAQDVTQRQAAVG